MAAPGMGQMSGMGMPNMGNMGGMPPQMTPQQQQMMHSQQHPAMQTQFHPQQHQMSMVPSPQQQMMMHQQQMSGQQPQQMHQMPPVGNMPGQPMQQMRPQIPPQNQQPPPQPEITPVLQSKLLIPQLKEALTNLMRVAAQNIHQNGLIDSCSKGSDNTPQKVDKYLEEFYAVCDQLELNLRLAIECNNANADSAKHTPRPVQTARQDPSQPDSQTYVQFLSLARLQAQQAQDTREVLLEGARKISEPAATIAARTVDSL